MTLSIAEKMEVVGKYLFDIDVMQNNIDKFWMHTVSRFYVIKSVIFSCPACFFELKLILIIVINENSLDFQVLRVVKDKAVVMCRVPLWECLIVELPSCNLLTTVNLVRYKTLQIRLKSFPISKSLSHNPNPNPSIIIEAA